MPRNCSTDRYLFSMSAGSFDCDTVSLIGIEKNFHHSDDILHQIISSLCFRKGRIGFFRKMNGLLSRN